MTWIFLIAIFGGLSILSFNKSIARRDFIWLTYITLIIFAIFYQPSERADMYRFREALIYIKEYGADAGYRELWYIYENSQIFFGIMVALSHLPTFMFFPICLMATYGIALAIFFDATKSVKLTRYQFGMLFSFFVCCVNFGIVFSIMRFFVAYYIGVAGIYIWFKHGRKTWLKIFSAVLIISSTFIHTAGFMVPVIWLLVMFYHIKWVRAVGALIPFAMLFSDQIIQFTNGIFGSVSLYNVIVQKFYRYTSYNYEDMAGRTRLFYYQILAIILIIVFMTKLLKRESGQFQSFGHFYMILLLLTIAYIPNETLFFRMLQVTLSMTPVYMALNVKSFSRSGAIQVVMLAECAIMLMFYGRLSTYFYL